MLSRVKSKGLQIYTKTLLFQKRKIPYFWKFWHWRTFEPYLTSSARNFGIILNKNQIVISYYWHGITRFVKVHLQLLLYFVPPYIILQVYVINNLFFLEQKHSTTNLKYLSVFIVIRSGVEVFCTNAFRCCKCMRARKKASNKKVFD